MDRRGKLDAPTEWDALFGVFADVSSPIADERNDLDGVFEVMLDREGVGGADRGGGRSVRSL